MNIINHIKDTISTIIGKINWETDTVITLDERDKVRELLTPHYYIILTRHNGHFSTYAICFAHWVLTKFKHWGYYGHVLMNLEDEVKSETDFRLIEAIGTGIQYSPFNKVFDEQCSSIALLKPKSLSLDAWTAIMDRAKTELGKPYDTLFELTDDKALSCVELVRTALSAEPNYATDFAEFERMIANCKNLDPQMFRECSDFEVVYEVRH
jgi:uncharacterized protein YycO